MISVLGYPLETAVALLESEGCAVQTEETHCRKGAQGADMRILRQRISDDRRTVSLTFAGFLTQPQQ